MSIETIAKELRTHGTVMLNAANILAGRKKPAHSVHSISAAGRKRISLAQKARWAKHNRPRRVG